MADTAHSEPFSAFMARALYDPERGYYTRRIRTVGARGDFSTSATLSPLLGQAIARWLRQEREEQTKVSHIIEIGAGDGSLMVGVRQALGWWQRRRFDWHIVETSPVLQARQKERLGAKVTWHDELGTALDQCGGRAFIYHNEVLDAFPVRLLQRHEDRWHEVWVNAAGQESLKPLEIEETQVFSALRDWPTVSPRQRCELHATVRDWLGDWAPHWQAGAMLTVDYGDVFPTLYHRRPAGTLRAYLHQHRLEGPSIYANVGRQDITSDVNFTDYRAWAAALGWEEAAYGTQAEFIQTRVKTTGLNGADAFLLHPDGAGSAFKHTIHRPVRG